MRKIRIARRLGLLAASVVTLGALLIPTVAQSAETNPRGCWLYYDYECYCAVWRTCAGTCNGPAGTLCNQ